MSTTANEPACDATSIPPASEAPSTTAANDSSATSTPLRRRGAVVPPGCNDDHADEASTTETPASTASPVPTQQQRVGLFSALRNWETPPAYRGRLRVALVLVVVALLARYLNGGERLPLEKLFNNVLYSSTSNTEDSFGYTIVYGPNFGVLILSLLVRFMLHRPQQHEHAE